MLCYAMLYNAYASAGSAASCSTGWDCSWACNQQSSSCFNKSTPSHPTPGEWVSCCFCLSSHREISCSAPPPHSSLGHPIGCHPFPKSPSLPWPRDVNRTEGQRMMLQKLRSRTLRNLLSTVNLTCANRSPSLQFGRWPIHRSRCCFQKVKAKDIRTRLQQTSYNRETGETMTRYQKSQRNHHQHLWPSSCRAVRQSSLSSKSTKTSALPPDWDIHSLMCFTRLHFGGHITMKSDLAQPSSDLHPNAIDLGTVGAKKLLTSCSLMSSGATMSSGKVILMLLPKA